MLHGLWGDKFYMIQSILLVIVVNTIILITYWSSVRMLLRKLLRCCYYLNSFAFSLQFFFKQLQNFILK